MKQKQQAAAKKPDGKAGTRAAILLLAAVLAILFWRSFLPEYIHFSNDGPLGAQAAADAALPKNFTGAWGDTNDIGSTGGAAALNLSNLLRLILGPVGYSKFYAPCALFIMGLGVWTFFRSLKLTWVATMLGTLAVVLNVGYFAGACWGVASAEIAIGFDFLALGLFLANENEPSLLVRSLRLILAGLCVGINVMEAADIGVLCSVMVAGVMFVKSLLQSGGNVVTRAATGVGRVAVVAVFAGFIATSTVISLLGTPGLVSNSSDERTPGQIWDWATQFSLPKRETLGIIVPGLYGYRSDTPYHMGPTWADKYTGGIYWGGIGREPAYDRYFDDGGTDDPSHGGLGMRFGYAGYYSGILVFLGALWAIGQTFRRKDPVFTTTQKILIWMWVFIMIAALLLAWGRFAPMFYGLLYQLPKFSAIRNPVKFIIFVIWAMAVLFAYGMDALSRRYLDPSIKNGTRKWDAFDFRLILVFAGIFIASIAGWNVYAAHKDGLVQYLQRVGFDNAEFADAIANFSIGQAEVALYILGGTVVLLALVARGFFSGSAAKAGCGLLIAFLLFDLGRADLPFIIHWKTKDKYEIGTLNPVEKILADKPYEHRVAKLLASPFQTPDQFAPFENLYGIEWTQHHFLYYNIQCLNVIQSPREATDLARYQRALSIGVKEAQPGQYALDPDTFYKLPRQWELSNTRYLLGPAPVADSFNAQIDGGQNRFRIVERFSVVPKPGLTPYYGQTDQQTVVIDPNGLYALYEFTGALPRVKLYGNWKVDTSDTNVLAMLAARDFDPAQTVLVDTPFQNLPSVSTNENTGTVEFKDYSSKHIVLTANAATPSVLLYNDRYDSHWAVTVDGKPVDLLRCNFIMRGIYLQPGQHTIEWNFSLPNRPLYVTLSAMLIGVILMVWLALAKRQKAQAAT
jgi:hypothetical protein